MAILRYHDLARSEKHTPKASLPRGTRRCKSVRSLLMHFHVAFREWHRQTGESWYQKSKFRIHQRLAGATSMFSDKREIFEIRKNSFEFYLPNDLE